MDKVPHRRYPCGNCPFRRDVPSGEFPAERYDALRASVGAPGEEAGLNAPLFACHKSIVGRSETCAGWLATVGYQHLRIRLAVVLGTLPAECLRPSAGWPDLFDTYDEMAEAQGGEL